MLGIITTLFVLQMIIAVAYAVAGGTKSLAKSGGYSDSRKLRDVTLRNMQDTKSNMWIPSAYKDTRGKFHARIYLPNIDHAVTVTAPSKEELESKVDKTYEEWR